MIKSGSAHNLILSKKVDSLLYKKFLDLKKLENEQKYCNIICEYNAIPYLYLCNEYSDVRTEDGAISIIFEFFASYADPANQLNQGNLTFSQIDEANSTMGLLELLAFCHFWNIYPNYITRQEISQTMRLIMKKGSPLKSGLNLDDFCDLLCYFSIILYDKIKINNRENIKKSHYINISNNVKTGIKIKLFLKYFKLDDKQYAMKEISRLKNVNEKLDANYLVACSDKKNKKNIIKNKPMKLGWSTKVEKEINQLTKQDYMIIHKNIRQNVKNDWRRFMDISLDIKKIYINNKYNYRYRIRVKNSYKKLIKITVNCDSKIFIIKYNKNKYIPYGIETPIYININYNKIRNDLYTYMNREDIVFINVMGNEKFSNHYLWTYNIPVYINIKPTQNSENIPFRIKDILPRSVKPDCL